MRIFKVTPDSNNVQALAPINQSLIGTEEFEFNCEPKKYNWTIPYTYIYNPKTKPTSFYNFNWSVLAFNNEVFDVFDSIFEMAGEILPIQVERGPKLYLLNILQCMNGLNYEKTQWDYYEDGTKGRILNHVIHRNRIINESTLFKIPEEKSLDIFCYADLKNPDDEFYHLYHKHKFTGLLFEEVETTE